MKKVTIIIILLIGAYVLFTIVKSFILVRQGVNLLETTNYPSKYIIGNSSKKIKYLVLGDSTAVGIGTRKLEETYPYQIALKLSGKNLSVEVINIAKSGVRVSDIVGEQLQKIKEINPDVISISIGGNDATHMTSEEEFEKNMRIIVKELERSNAKIILFGSTPNMFRIPALPRWFSWLAGRKSIKQNEITKSILTYSTTSQFNYVDIYNKARLQRLEEYAQDWFHPNDKGYKKWARTFKDELED